VRVKEEKERLRTVKCRFFAECTRSGTRQRFFLNLKIYFAKCPRSGTRQSPLCGVSPRRHSTKIISLYFVECHPVHTWQRLLCRVSSLDTRQSTFLFFYFPNQTFCGMFLHYVDLHVPFWDNYNSVFNS
jgi:hypothetical protein